MIMEYVVLPQEQEYKRYLFVNTVPSLWSTSFQLWQHLETSIPLMPWLQKLSGWLLRKLLIIVRFLMRFFSIIKVYRDIKYMYLLLCYSGVNFNHRSVFPVMFDGESIGKWWKSALVFKVYSKTASQKVVSSNILLIVAGI